MTLLFAFAIVLPLILWVAWRRTEKVVYTGQALIVDTWKLGDRGRLFITVSVPELDKTFVAGIPAKREAALKVLAIGEKADVVLSRFIIGKPRVQSMRLPGEAEAGTVRSIGDVAGLAAAYLLGGMGALVAQVLWASPVMLMIGGFMLGYHELLDRQVSADQVPKAQKFLFGVLAVVCGLVTLVLFQEFSILTLFFGLASACACGQLIGMLAYLSESSGTGKRV